jgi:hypothetical protein
MGVIRRHKAKLYEFGATSLTFHFDYSFQLFMPELAWYLSSHYYYT